MVGEFDSATPAPPESATFASPKSSTFTLPCLSSLILAGFRSRWIIPRSCAASSASAICRAIGSASSSGPAQEQCGQRAFHRERIPTRETVTDRPCRNHKSPRCGDG
jgi:hypothetical protein